MGGTSGGAYRGGDAPWRLVAEGATLISTVPLDARASRWHGFYRRISIELIVLVVLFQLAMVLDFYSFALLGSLLVYPVAFWARRRRLFEWYERRPVVTTGNGRLKDH